LTFHFYFSDDLDKAEIKVKAAEEEYASFKNEIEGL